MTLSTSSSSLGPLLGVHVLYTFPYGPLCSRPKLEEPYALAQAHSLHLLPLALSLTFSSSRCGNGGGTLILVTDVLEPMPTPESTAARGHALLWDPATELV